MSNLNEETKINQLVSEAKSLKNQISSKTQYFTGLLSQMNNYSCTKGHMSDCINTLNKNYRSLED
ncbi:MAG: hypothetical protein LUE64_01250, partial [Candidatus Gastranaerophilales bacterium]|nr:hypothetical protein [Candidatus Gastranaerophilales bacterium]